MVARPFTPGRVGFPLSRKALALRLHRLREAIAHELCVVDFMRRRLTLERMTVFDAVVLVEDRPGVLFVGAYRAGEQATTSAGSLDTDSFHWHLLAAHDVKYSANVSGLVFVCL